MLKIEFDQAFKRAYKKKVTTGSDRHARFTDKLRTFSANPFDSSLKTHKLTGKLKDYWSFSVEYDIRVIFYFEDPETAIFIDIGTHDEVYD